jgi:tetratricopeptide (TPR) repeat protein
MLMLHEGYAAKFPEFLARITSAESSQKILGDVYGKSPGELEKEMLAYFRQDRIGGATYAPAAAKVTVQPGRPATEAEVELHLARIVGMLGRRDEARDRLARLAASYPGDRRVDEAQAYVALLSGDRATALSKLEQVISQGGASSWKTYWDYAALLHRSGKADKTELIDVLREALQRKPDLAAGRLMLARVLYAIGRRSQALSELRQIRDVEPREAASMYLLMAQSAIELSQPDEARQYAEQARKHAKRAEDLTRVEALLQRLDAASVKAGTEATDEEDDRRPVLRRKDPPKPASRKAKTPPG